MASHKLDATVDTHTTHVVRVALPNIAHLAAGDEVYVVLDPGPSQDGRDMTQKVKLQWKVVQTMDGNRY